MPATADPAMPPIPDAIDAAGPTPRSGRRWWFAGLTLCLVMLVVHVLAGMNSNGMSDFWRDMYWAAAIAHGERFPLAGPPIYGLFELGPWWFYLLALPMGLTGSVALTAAFVQALAAAKYLLAWRLGRRIGGERLGFALAAASAVAGWSMLPLMFPSHTAVVETTVLLLAFVTLRGWNRFDARGALLFGLAAAACIHAHPTTLAYVACAGALLLWRHRSRAVVGWMALAVVIVLASLLPPWLDRDAATQDMLKSVPAYVGDLRADSVARIPGVLRSLVVGGAWWGLLLMTHWTSAVAAIAWWIYCACLLAAAIGFVRLRTREPRLFRLALAAIAFLVLQVAFVVSIRPVTPMWMVASCLPPLSLAVALGWHGWLRDVRTAVRVVATVVLGLQLALALVPFSMHLRELHATRVMPGVNPFYNVTERSDRYVNVAVPFYPVRRLDRLAATLCGPAVLHGRLAALVEATFATPVRNACGHWPALRYGGVEGSGPHIAGLLSHMATATGIAPTRVVARMALYEPVRAIAPFAGGRLEPLRRLQIHPDSGTGFGRSEYNFVAAGGDVLVVTNRMRNAGAMTLDRIEADGRAAVLLGQDGSSFAYGCHACDPEAPVRWHVELEGIAENLDLVVLPHAAVRRSD